MLFSKPDLVIWPKNHNLDVYFSSQDNNHFVFEIDLFQPLADQDCLSLASFFKDRPSSRTFLIIPNHIFIYKSFLYESNIDTINQQEIMAMAKSSLGFESEMDLLSYKLEQQNQKTIIRACFIDSQKIKVLKDNLDRLAIKLTSYQSLSDLISQVVSQFYQDQYSLIYPIDQSTFLYLLADKVKIYLTDIIKPTSQEINKKINYSELYFGKLSPKFFQPADFNQDLKLNSSVSINPFDEAQISSKLGQLSNLPLPVLAFFDKAIYNQLTKNSDTIITDLQNINHHKPTMISETKTKNPLIIFIVFILSLVLVSAGLWFFSNRQTASDVVSPIQDSQIDNQPVEITPTPEPSPTLAEVNKNLKIKVLNATEINGLAAKLKASLSQLGFTDITTGNSTDSLSQHTIQTKAQYQSYQNYFQQKLTTMVGFEFTSDLKDTDSYDVIITIASNLSTGQSPTTSPLLTPTLSE